MRGAVLLALATVLAAKGAEPKGEEPRPVELRVDRVREPLAIGSAEPGFSWRYAADGPARQAGYRIQVATTREALLAGRPDVWDTGEVAGAASLDVRYGGPALEPGQRYWWRVRAKPGGWSLPDWWAQAPAGGNWTARWIAHRDTGAEADRGAGAWWVWGNDRDDTRLRRFRWPVRIAGPIRSASLLVTGKDFLSVWVNGVRVAGGARPPAFERERIAWGTMSDLPVPLRSGANLLAFEVGVDRGGYLPVPVGGLVAILRIERPDGRVERRVLDVDALTAPVPVENAAEDWTKEAFDDRGWPRSQRVAALGAPPFGAPWPPGPAALLRRSFIVSGQIASARLHAAALGAIELRLNGAPAASDRLAPDMEDNRVRASYRSYDVTGSLRQGENALGVILGDGWYASGLGWDLRRHLLGPPPNRVLVRLDIRYGDGRRQSVVSDGRWRSVDGPIRSSEIYAGERYDARRERPGWDMPGFADRNWAPVVMPPTSVPVGPALGPRVRRLEVLRPVRQWSVGPRARVFDFGRNMAGVARVAMRATRGRRVTLRFAERLTPDGRVDQRNLRMALARDVYVARGGRREIFEPRFTYHGFRYVQIDGLDRSPESLEAVRIGSDVATSGRLTTGVLRVNAIVDNAVRSLRANLMGVPTDCPQRDERLGWLGDAQLFWGTAAYLVDAAAFSRKFVRDIRGAQSLEGGFPDVAPRVVDTRDGAPGWGDAGVILPWIAWRRWGDLRIVEESWPAMERWMAYIAAANPDGVWRERRNADFGDWLAPVPTSKELIATAYWAHDAKLMAAMAAALGNHAAEARYAAEFARLAGMFRSRYVKEDGTVGEGTQTAQAIAVAFGLVDGPLQDRVADLLAASARRSGIATGFLGTPVLLPALSETGHARLAYDLLLSRRYPSWGFMVDHGATSIWERWDGGVRADSMNSLNHYALGAVVEWLYRDAAGIRELEPGFKRFEIAPRIDARLGHLEATFDSPYGRIASRWRVRGATAEIVVTVPPNAEGRLRLPDGSVRPLLPGISRHHVALKDVR